MNHIHRIKEKNQQVLFDCVDNEIAKQKRLLREFEESFLDWEKIRLDSVTKERHLECAVCMETMANFSKNSKKSDLMLLSCGHIYHNNCLNSWVMYKNGTEECPLCRQSYS